MIMGNKSTKYLGTLVMAALLLTVSALIPLRAWASPAGGPAAQTQSDLDHLKSLSGKEFEVEWMSMMIEHHQGAIDMSKLAATRAMHQEVKDVAQNIINAQTTEITEMTRWLQQWYGTMPMQGLMHGMDMATQLQNLSGDDFDKQFLTMMTEHHQGAIDMAQLVPEQATHQELKTLSQNIITSQQAEVNQFGQWLSAWYTTTPVAGSTGGNMGGGDMGGTTPGSSPGMPRTGSGESAGSLLLLALAAIGLAALSGGAWLRERASASPRRISK